MVQLKLESKVRHAIPVLVYRYLYVRTYVHRVCMDYFVVAFRHLIWRQIGTTVVVQIGVQVVISDLEVEFLQEFIVVHQIGGRENIESALKNH